LLNGAGVELEEKMFREGLHNVQTKDNLQKITDKDSDLLRMIQSACSGKRQLRALELTTMLTLKKSWEIAIKIAQRNHLNTLSEKILQLWESKNEEQEKEKDTTGITSESNNSSNLNNNDTSTTVRISSPRKPPQKKRKLENDDDDEINFNIINNKKSSLVEPDYVSSDAMEGDEEEKENEIRQERSSKEGSSNIVNPFAVKESNSVQKKPSSFLESLTKSKLETSRSKTKTKTKQPKAKTTKRKRKKEEI